MSASLVDLQVAQRRAQDRRVDAEPIGAADKVTEEVVGLGRASGLDIVQHRRSAGRTLLGEETAVEVYQRSRRRVAFGGRNPGTFVECRGDEGGPCGCGSNLAGAGPSQHGDRRSTGKAAEFCPHLGKNIVADRGRNPTGYESTGDLLAPGRALTSEFANRGLSGFPIPGTKMSPSGVSTTENRVTPPSTRAAPRRSLSTAM